ncbi:MAG: RsmB/NOP family class I SAM-dependent RNA methyltransferase [Eubacterium sp.]|nr:RsmB/NOP family class I SAM-dependent RNA methyltransferase [Eubacterium sp.]
MHFPEKFILRLRKQLGEDTEQYIRSFDYEYGQTFRVNQLKAEPADFVRRFLLPGETRPVAWCETGYYYSGEKRLSRSPLYYAGTYYLQEPSAMAPAAFLDVRPGDRVLDLCAAPGGKSTAMAAAMKGQGLLVANDVSNGRCMALMKNLEMAGVHNMMISCETPQRLASRFSGYFDKVLVDAPCSGEGMFRRDSSMMAAWSPEKVEEYAKLQKEILHSAAQMVRPGGKLLYSTCTYGTAEDEEVVADLLESMPDFRPAALPDYEGVEKGIGCARFWQHRVDGEGQFAALLIREGGLREEGKERPGTGSREKGAAGKKRPGDRDLCLSFLSEINWKRILGPETIEDCFKSGRIFAMKERIFLLPENCPDFSGLRLVRSGLYLGDLKKKRFEPSPALALALKAEEYPRTLRLDPEDPDVLRYLRGETIEIGTEKGPDEKGWTLVCLEEFPLGWGKSDGVRMKNKYPPGWRMM